MRLTHAGQTSSSLSQQELGTAAGEVGNGILYILIHRQVKLQV